MPFGFGRRSCPGEVELKTAVWDCGVDKTPGPDGFSFGFYRHFWDTIEADVFDAVNHFFSCADIPKGCNSSFIALILKSPDANMVKDFRPISLIGSLYKIIAKILASRLVYVLGELVNETQSAFIADRQNLDGPFILNEVIQWCSSKKKQAIIFKVDFEKAYDSVRWDFLDEILSKFGFGHKWRMWIQSCLTSSRGSIIINGSPTEEFQFYKGLKQGDPLSPFLFILIMESLHLSFQRVVDAGMFKGIQRSTSMNISHMFYADDVVFVGLWCDGNINTLIHVLDCFHRASGLKINMSKSKILGVNVKDIKVSHDAAKLGCLILKVPFIYFGSKVGGNMSCISAWKEVIDKVQSRLSKWKSKTLSIGGRLTLLKSVLRSIPIFYMSLYRVSKKRVVDAGMFKGIQRSTSMNISHMFYADDAVFVGLWCDGNINTLIHVLDCFHRASGIKINMSKSKILGVNVEDIKVSHDAAKLGCLILKVPFIYFGSKVGGNMSCISAWKDVIDKVQSRLSKWKSKTLSIGGRLTLLKSVLRSIPIFYMYLYRVPKKADRYVWTLNGSGEYSVASMRKILDDFRAPTTCSPTRWVQCVPIKINVFAWKVKMDGLPTRFNISHRVWFVISTVRFLLGGMFRSGMFIRMWNGWNGWLQCGY
nr:RNA-directed DNA polymerase, eukaryota [Tanacetum cinerariifolium]